MGEKRRAIVLLVSFLLLITGVFIFFPNQQRTITSSLNYSDFNIINFPSDGEYNFSLENGRGARIGNSHGEETFSVYVNTSEGVDDLIIVTDLGDEEKLLPGGIRKLDVDSDGYYEVMVSYSGKNEVRFMQIHEKVDALSELREVISSQITGSFSKQFSYSYILFVLLLVLLVLLFLYVYKIYIWPMARLKRVRGKQSNLETINYLIGEFKKSIRIGDKKKANISYSRIKHVSRYLNHKEKVRMKDKLNEIEKIFIVSLAK